MDKQQIAIFGATSAIGVCVAQQLADQSPMQFYLLGRNANRLAQVSADLQSRGSDCKTIIADFNNLESHDELVQACENADEFFMFFGTLPDQSLCQSQFQKTQAALQSNFISPVSLLTRVAHVCETRQSGKIVVVGSVAGDRGRGSNYIYGSAKGGLEIFMQGLRNRLNSAGVQVVTIKPGFVDTPMTTGIEKKPAILWAKPDRVATDIIKATSNRKNTIYSPWFWRYIMLVIRLIPEFVFKKLSL